VRFVLVILVVLSLALCALGGLAEGIVRAGGYLARLWPPDLRYFPKLVPAIVDTLLMSLAGTTLAMLSAIPLSYFGSRDLVGNPVLYATTRFVMSVMRATPVLVLGIMFVAALGMGMTAGILGLWFHCTGALGKFMSESLDAADKSVREAAIMDGASRWETYAYVLLPMQVNAYLSFYLYYIESNFRSAVVLGVVGAGGIGLELITVIGMFKYHRIGLIVLLVIAVALALDFLSRWVRGRFLKEYGDVSTTSAL